MKLEEYEEMGNWKTEKLPRYISVDNKRFSFALTVKPTGIMFYKNVRRWGLNIIVGFRELYSDAG